MTDETTILPNQTILIDRFTAIIGTIRTIVIAQGPVMRLAAPFICLILGRLARYATRFPLMLNRTSAPRRAARQQTSQDPTQKRPHRVSLLPRGNFWLTELMQSADLDMARLDMLDLVHEAAMAGLVAANPALARVLRPVCTMLGIRLPTILQRPKSLHPRPPRPKRPSLPRSPRWKDPYYPRDCGGVLPTPVPLGPGSRFWPPFHLMKKLGFPQATIDAFHPLNPTPGAAEAILAAINGPRNQPKLE